MPYLDSPDGEWVQTQLARMTEQARASGFYDKDVDQAQLFRPGSDELRNTISKLVRLSSPPPFLHLDTADVFQQTWLNFCRPLMHRSRVDVRFTDGKPFMELMIHGTQQVRCVRCRRAKI